MSTLSYLTKFGVAVPTHELFSFALIPRVTTSQAIVREHSLAGINYVESSKISIFVRFFLYSNANTVLKSAGVESIEILNAVERLDPKTNEPVSVEEPSGIYFVEYQLSETELEAGAPMPITMHPRYLELLPKSKTVEKNGKQHKVPYETLFANRIQRYIDNVNNLGTSLNFNEDEDAIADIDDDAAFSGPRITQTSMDAQAEAHRRAKEKARQIVDGTFDYFEKTILSSRTEDISIEELSATYSSVVDSNGPIFDVSRLLNDVASEIRTIDISE